METDALNHLTTHTYDAVNRLVDTTDALGVVTHRDYDSFGNLTRADRGCGTPRRGPRLRLRPRQPPDPADRPGGPRQAYEYDAVGNRLKVTDARGFATNYVYDALNRNIKIIDPLAFQTRFEYDGVGNRITIVDARGGIQRLTYDAGNRYIQTTDAEGPQHALCLRRARQPHHARPRLSVRRSPRSRPSSTTPQNNLR